MLAGLFKDARFGPFSNLHTCISLVEVYWFGQCFGRIFSPISTFFSLVGCRGLRDSPLSRFRCGILDQWLPNFLKIPHLPFPQIYTHVFYFRKSIDLDSVWRFSHISTFFSPASCRAFRDAPQSRFRCGNPNQCLPNFIKMLLLALPQNYTRVLHL